MAEVNLLRRYPRARRNIEKRTGAQSEENIRIAREYGREYFDGSRDTGYGGYRYDGRWLPIAESLRPPYEGNVIPLLTGDEQKDGA
jgi:hypothetical protein